MNYTDENAAPSANPEADDGFDFRCVIDRSQEVVTAQNFFKGVVDGIDFVQLFVRMEHWLRRQMTRSEMGDFVNSAVAASDGASELELVCEQEAILLPATDGHLLVGWGGDDDPIRDYYNRSGGRVAIREVFAAALLGAEGTSASPVVASAIKSLKPGESWTRLLYDARLFNEDESRCPTASRRLVVEHRLSGGYEVSTETLCWNDREGYVWYSNRGEEGWADPIGTDTADEAVQMIPAYVRFGEQWTESMRSDWELHHPKREEVAA